MKFIDLAFVLIQKCSFEAIDNAEKKEDKFCYT